MNKYQKEYCQENGMKYFNNYNKNDYTDFLENKLEQLSLCGVTQQSKLLRDYSVYLDENKFYLCGRDRTEVAIEWLSRNSG